MDVDTQQLRYFVTLAEYLNFNEAAKHLFITQPALSYAISNLEKKLNLKLFYRDKRSVKLTAGGKMFLQEAIEIVNKLDMAVEKARETSSGSTGNLKIGFLGSLIKKDFPKWIPRFRKKYSHINLDLKQFSMTSLRNSLEKGHIDIGFTRSYDLLDSLFLTWKKIHDDQLCLVMHKDYPLAKKLSKKASIDYSSLGNEPFIIINQQTAPSSYNKVIQVCTKLGFVPKITYTPNSMETVFTLLDAGLGISLLPHSCHSYYSSNIISFDLEGVNNDIDYVVAWRKNNDNPAIFLFLEEIGVKLYGNDK